MSSIFDAAKLRDDYGNPRDNPFDWIGTSRYADSSRVRFCVTASDGKHPHWSVETIDDDGTIMDGLDSRQAANGWREFIEQIFYAGAAWGMRRFIGGMYSYKCPADLWAEMANQYQHFNVDLLPQWLKDAKAEYEVREVDRRAGK